MPNPPRRNQPLHVARRGPRPRRLRLHNPPSPKPPNNHPLRQPLPRRHASQQSNPPPLQTKQLHSPRRVPLPSGTRPPGTPPRRANVRHRPRRHLATNPPRTVATHLRRIQHLARLSPGNLPPRQKNLPPRILRNLAFDTHVRLRNAGLAHGQDNPSHQSPARNHRPPNNNRHQAEILQGYRRRNRVSRERDLRYSVGET